MRRPYSLLAFTLALGFTLNLAYGEGNDATKEPVADTSAAAPAAAAVLKTVELEWEAVPDAASYVIKLTPAAGGDPIYFTATEAHLTQQVPVGTYELRIRSRAKDEDVYSPWSDPIALEVVVKQLIPLSPPDKATLEAHGDNKMEVEFSWSPIDKIKEYHIKIWTEDAADKPLEFTTRQTKKKLSVRTGHQYFWQVSFESATDTAYAQTPQTFSFSLAGAKLMPPKDIKVTRKGENQILTWTAPADAKEYKGKLYYRHLDETEYKMISETKIAKAEWNAGKLRPGSYKVEIVAHAANRTDSEPASFEFLIKPLETEIYPPLAKADPPAPPPVKPEARPTAPPTSISK